MQLFRHQNRDRNAATDRIYAAYELAYTIVDFLAALSFLAGSIMFFWKEYETPAIWLFVVGSAFFFLKPTIRLTREIRLASMGDTEDLAERFNP